MSFHLLMGMTCEIAGEKKDAPTEMASTHCASLIAGNLRISAPETRSGQNTDTCTQKLGILLPKLFWPTVRKHCSSDQEKLLKLLK